MVKCLVITAKGKLLLTISDQCLYSILPENARKPKVFREYEMGTLTTNGLTNKSKFSTSKNQWVGAPSAITGKMEDMLLNGHESVWSVVFNYIVVYEMSCGPVYENNHW